MSAERKVVSERRKSQAVEELAKAKKAKKSTETTTLAKPKETAKPRKVSGPSEPRRAEKRAANVPKEPIIEFEDLTYVYPGGAKAISGVSLTIREGERVAILGHNGAGKSTLSMHLNALLTPASGKARLFGRLISKDALPEIRRRIGLVFQDPDDQLFSTTVWDDVAFGPTNMGLPPEEVEARVEEALGVVGMEGYESTFPHRLSMGQKKRVAIATVLAMRPEVLVMDEPTAGLDPKGERSIINFVLGLYRKNHLTIIVSTSSPELAEKLADRVVLMSKGQIVADGPAGKVLRDRKLLKSADLI